MLEFVLLTALAVLAYQLHRLRQKQRIMRHVFIAHSDWCADKILALSQSAREQITDLAHEAARARGDGGGEVQDYAGDVSYDVLKAPFEVREQIDRMQTQLQRNGIPPLGFKDLDGTIFNPRLQKVMK